VEHALEEAERRLDGWEGADERAGLADEAQLAPALGALLEVGAHAALLAGGELAVEQGAEQVAGVAVHVRVNASRSMARPRWMRLRTVPTGTPSTSLISW
jgi:hypothetical protein